jgi:hypothetical protein
LLREAEERLKRTRDPMEIVDMLHILEASATHFFLRAQMGKKPAGNPRQYRSASGRRFPKYRQWRACASDIKPSTITTVANKKRITAR